MRREKSKYDMEAAAAWNLPPDGQPVSIPHTRRFAQAEKPTRTIHEKQSNKEES